MKLTSRKQGQTMVEYIIIVVLIAVTLLVVVGFFGKALFKKFSGATSALDEDVGAEAQDAYADIDDPQQTIRRLDETGEMR